MYHCIYPIENRIRGGGSSKTRGFHKRTCVKLWKGLIFLNPLDFEIPPLIETWTDKSMVLREVEETRIRETSSRSIFLVTSSILMNLSKVITKLLKNTSTQAWCGTTYKLTQTRLSLATSVSSKVSLDLASSKAKMMERQPILWWPQQLVVWPLGPP